MRSGIQGFQSQRLKQLRASAAMTQIELAERIQCVKGNISKWEQGKSSPEASSFQKICDVFNVPSSWLMEEPIASPETHPSFFRAKNKTPKISREIAKIRLDWAEEVSYKLQESLEFPDINLPEYTGDFKVLTDYEIEDLATECRQRWELGQRPIQNLINVMEGNGVVVTRGTLGFTKMDGVSRWSKIDSRPYVFLCMDKANGFRARFDAGHELGHIVLHKKVTDAEYQKNYHLLENQAHRFASALLLPASSFVRDVHYPTMETFLALKPKWKVSVAAMIRRCQDLEVISDQTALRLWKARSARGWTAREPLDDTLEPEEPKLLQRSIKMLVENNILDKCTLRQMLGAPAHIIEELSNLPKNYFNQDQPDKVIELRIRNPSQQGQTTQQMGIKGRVIKLEQRKVHHGMKDV
ncbi:MAG: ImmA/IrrE family metallo-endopeptidase [Marinospirillum sp.]|uniref:XRE family transcriptional regulator n=1 Tax=Marinospirillum sp. TaxID=2183934 RepID=UPI001A066176|nr:XRE family transcriptional regulator [Marinospirillum sp.]MBE0508910.1 ImmA/IrrE family metallo-endopeptidase [Marinospirillum sp.]